MAQMPRWARKQMLEHKLSNVLNNPYADVSTVSAARKAIDIKLDLQDSDYKRQQYNITNNFLKRL